MSKGTKLPEALTPAEEKEIELKCEELAKKYNCSKVHVVVFIDKDTRVRTYCFLKEPNFPTKISVMDKMAAIGIYNAAEELREATVLKTESDAITYGDNPECDDFKMGVVQFCVTMIRMKENAYKKK